MINSAVIIGVFIYMAAIIGMWLFAGLLKIENDNDNVVLKNHRSNFDTISQAFVTVFHVI